MNIKCGRATEDRQCVLWCPAKQMCRVLNEPTRATHKCHLPDARRDLLLAQLGETGSEIKRVQKSSVLEG